MLELWEVLLLGLAAATILPTLFYALRTGVPPVPCSAAEARAVARLLREVELPPGGRIYEVGCGWGGLACALAAAFPEAEVRGLEISPLPCLVAWLRARWTANLQISWADADRRDLSSASAVATYLMIGAMPRLAATLDRSLAPGTPVVVVAFRFRDRVPALVSRGDGVRRADALLYRWPAKPDGLDGFDAPAAPAAPDAPEGADKPTPAVPTIAETSSQGDESRPKVSRSAPSA